jgi:tetratricopeptide (TPR) repeat protein
MNLRRPPLLALALASALLACTRPPRAGAPAPSGPTGPSGLAAAPAVRPPFRCLPGTAAPGAAALVRAADDALDDGDDERALGCADEALRAEPRGVHALADRGDALAGLGRPREAQLAFTRALAVDPDDALALAGAADLYVRSLDGAHDALEAGLELALRGLRALTRVPRRDEGLAARLELAAAAALNDLGRAGEALPHAERAVALDPEEPAAASERGFALFELCRFDEAKAAFERALALQPDDAWSLHQLGLLAERRGDGAAAERLLARARERAPADFPPEVAIDAAAFRAEVDRAIGELSPADRKALLGVPVEAADLPSTEDLTASSPPLSPTILGLYRGPPEGEPCLPEDRPVPLHRPLPEEPGPLRPRPGGARPAGAGDARARARPPARRGRRRAPGSGARVEGRGGRPRVRRDAPFVRSPSATTLRARRENLAYFPPLPHRGRWPGEGADRASVTALRARRENLAYFPPLPHRGRGPGRGGVTVGVRGMSFRKERFDRASAATLRVTFPPLPHRGRGPGLGERGRDGASATTLRAFRRRPPLGLAAGGLRPLTLRGAARAPGPRRAP